MLWIGILPALAVVFVRYFVKEPAVWVENRRLQREQNRECRAPLLSIFKRELIGNTLTACWWMASGIVTVFVAPLYLLTTDLTLIIAGFVLQGLFGDALYGQNPSYLSERFPTEVRAAASAFCYHQGAIFGGLVAPILSYFAINYNLGFGIPMLVGTAAGAISFVIALLLGPET